jgi:hypothetical membrane protein
MIAVSITRTSISASASLKIIGIFGATFGLIGTFLAAVAYLPSNPGFSMFTTFLSDIGDAPGWPQILFNSTTLIMAPIRLLIIALVVICLSQIGAGIKFAKTIMILGSISTIGTVIMTAVPFSVSTEIHLAGIPMYFFGLVVWQTIVGIKEWTLKVPRILPVLSFLVVIAFLLFFILFILYESNIVGRTAAPIWQWAGFFLSLIWVYAHSIVFREMDKNQ